MEYKIVKIDKPDEMNFILGHSHFIKTVEDLHETLVQSVPGIKFGVGFCEASQHALVRWSGNDDKLIDLAKKNAYKLSAGHMFIVFIENAFPLNVLNAVKMIPEVVSIHCATGNPVEVILVESDMGRGIIGIIDGVKSKGIETEEDVVDRKKLLRKFGYKL